ncbi:MAG: diacylglycerol kinase family protein [Firmicutes bacterium]|nr:diacylglycerol kinase family protein [Bacillota bacterium]
MKKFLHGFIYAFSGIITCIREERNFRFHMAAAFHLFAYLPFFDLSKAELCILVMLCGAVFALEAVNTAIENAIDSTGIVSKTAGIAKDTAAGAVLIAAVISVICGVIILWQPAAFAAIFKFYIDAPIAIIAQIVVLIFWIWFVFLWHRK